MARLRNRGLALGFLGLASTSLGVLRGFFALGRAFCTLAWVLGTRTWALLACFRFGCRGLLLRRCCLRGRCRDERVNDVGDRAFEVVDEIFDSLTQEVVGDDRENCDQQTGPGSGYHSCNTRSIQQKYDPEENEPDAPHHRQATGVR